MSLRIAQVAPLWENVPPQHYGGTERIVSYVTENLVQQGHEVTLFACGTSKTQGRLVSVYPRPLFSDGIAWTNIMYPLLNITEVFEKADEFDIIHIHLNKASDYLALPLAQAHKDKVIFTLHFPYPASQNRHDRHLVFQKYRDLNYISISNSQRQGGENLNWLATIHNGIDITPYTFSNKPKDYFLWIGKFNPDKGIHEAILAAKEADVKLILGGKIDELEHEDLQYYREKVEPFIDDKQIIYVGELNDAEKNEYYGGAIAFLNPLQWNEPFGLTMTESMACGTPVIAFANGAAPEIVIDGETGFLVTDVPEMVKRMKEVGKLNRAACRERVEQHFTAAQMTTKYLEVFNKVIHLSNDNR